MDLFINRLKILGEEEIKKLDLKITEYENQKSILDKSIDEIKRQIRNFSTICQKKEDEIKFKTSIITNLSKTLIFIYLEYYFIKKCIFCKKFIKLLHL